MEKPDQQLYPAQNLPTLPPYQAPSDGYINSAFPTVQIAPVDTVGLGLMASGDIEAGFTSRGLDNVDVRRGFIRKVYLILTCQLTFTFTAVLLATAVRPLSNLLLGNLWLFIAACVVFIVVYIALLCSTKLRRETPGNFIALCVFTVALTLVAATLAACFSTNAMLVAMGIAVGVCVGVTLFVLQTRIEFTLVAGLLFAVALSILLFGIACLATFLAYRGGVDPMTARLLDCVYGGLVALLLAICLLVDTHLVIGGSGGYELSEEEYVFGALQLYIDVVYLFIMLLGIRR